MSRQIAFGIAGLFVASVVAFSVFGVPSAQIASRDSQVAATVQTISPYKQNAILLNGSLVPAYSTNEGFVAYQLSGGKLTSYARDGAVRWSQYSTASGLSGGMDLNSDTYPEVITTGFTDGSCNGTSQGEIRDGKTGAVLAGLSPLQHKCFSGVGVQRWYVGSVLIGPLPVFAEVPQYWAQGWFMQYQNGSFKSMPWYTSSDATFDSYTAATTLPHYFEESPQKYVPNSMLPNGLLMTGSDGAARMVAFTSARVSQYKVADLSPSQLISDTELVAGNRPDAGGRNYGLVARSGYKVVLISGANAYSLLGDVKAGSAVTDSYGAITRHVAVFDTTNAKVIDRFYSYAYDSGGSYVNRITYPAHPIVDLSGTPHVFFNVYDGTKWYVSVNTLDLTEVARVANIYIWDTIERTDGAQRFVVSRTTGYWPESPHQTFITYYQNAAFIPELTKNGLPIMGVAFKEPNISSSEGFLMNVLVTDQGLETDGLPEAASLTIHPASATVAYNAGTTIYWSAVNTSSCTFYTNSAAGQTLSGGASAFDTGPLQQNMTYSMRCLGRDGKQYEASTAVTVGAPANAAPSTTSTPLPTILPGTVVPPTPSTIPPAPTNLSTTCSADGKSATFKWNAVSGATSYSLRLNDTTNDNAFCTDGWYCTGAGDQYNDNVTTNSWTTAVVPGRKYDWWVHAQNAAGPSAGTRRPLYLTCAARAAPSEPISTVAPLTAQPTATLLANGEKNISVRVGSYIDYSWTSSNAVSARATYTTDSPVCGRSSVGPFSMLITSLGGSMRSAAVPPCLAGHTRTITYSVKGVDGSEASASVVQTITQ